MLACPTSVIHGAAEGKHTLERFRLTRRLLFIEVLVKLRMTVTRSSSGEVLANQGVATTEWRGREWRRKSVPVCAM